MKSNVIALNATAVERVTAAVTAGRAPDPDSLRLVKKYQRAFIAARVATTKMGGAHEYGSHVRTNEWLAEVLEINKATVSNVRTILKHALPKEIALVETGDIGIASLFNQIRRGVSPEERAKFAAVPRQMRGRAGEWKLHRRFRAELWASLKSALENLTGLPRPTDMAALMKEAGNPSITRAIDQKLLSAQSWLEEFCDAWTQP